MKKIIELDPGRYYFAFCKNDNLQKRTFKVEFNRIIDESDEDNHVSINIGEQVTTKVNNDFDQDYFDFTITEPRLYKIKFTSDNAHVRYDVFNENNEKIMGYKKYDQEITLSEGQYIIVLYQPSMNGDKLRYATFTIRK